MKSSFTFNYGDHELEAYYEANTLKHRSEPRTFDYPGSPAWIEVTCARLLYVETGEYVVVAPSVSREHLSVLMWQRISRADIPDDLINKLEAIAIADAQRELDGGD